MSGRKLISDIGEFGLIERIKQRIEKAYVSKSALASLVVGIGDDAAVIRSDAGKMLVATTDMLVEGVHFDLKTSSPYDVGWKAMAVNLSDIAAMGALPRYGLVVLGLPVDTPVETVDNLIKGALDLAKKFKVFFIGGDIVTSPKNLVVNLTAWGVISKDKILKRSGARVGDRIMVTGTLGDSTAGLAILKRRKKIGNRWEKYLVKRHQRPFPRVRESGIIAARKWANSMIDSSDGLALSLKFICGASRVGAKVWLNKIPVSSALRRMSLTGGKPSSYFGLYGAEDYELVFTVPKGKEKKVIKAISGELGTNVTIIGEIVPHKRGISLIDNQERISNLELKGYEHFKPSKL